MNFWADVIGLLKFGWLSEFVSFCLNIIDEIHCAQAYLQFHLAGQDFSLILICLELEDYVKVEVIRGQIMIGLIYR